MKRSYIESYVSWAKRLVETCGMKLLPFGYWDIDEWRRNTAQKKRIISTMLGWDITDYGRGDFETLDSVLFTIRNGVMGKQDIGTPYAEKILPTMEGQRLPLHFHYSKCEDIINRGGGVMWIKLYLSREDESVDHVRDVTVYMDGMRVTVPAGKKIYVNKGESITLTPRLYHTFGTAAGHSLRSAAGYS